MTGTHLFYPRLRSKTDEMEKLDRIGWPTGISLESYGVRIGVRTSDAALMEKVKCCLPPLWKPARTPCVDFLYSLEAGNDRKGRFHVLYRGPLRTIRTKNLNKALQYLEQSLEFTVATRANARLFVHAGVVGWRGRAIVIPGRTMSGKSSMVAALLRAGANYYSDEFAVFDSSGRVYPYPRVLRIRQNGRQQNHFVEEFSVRLGKRALHVGLIAALKYKPGIRWRPRILSPAEAVLTLLDNTILARYLTNLTTFKAVASSALAIKANRGEAEEVATRLLEYLAHET
ncbi:hypothetical protein L0222_25290 [bacterium]|nr:hypothetical protein [bacterium]